MVCGFPQSLPSFPSGRQTASSAEPVLQRTRIINFSYLSPRIASVRLRIADQSAASSSKLTADCDKATLNGGPFGPPRPSRPPNSTSSSPTRSLLTTLPSRGPLGGRPSSLSCRTLDDNSAFSFSGSWSPLDCFLSAMLPP